MRYVLIAVLVAGVAALAPRYAEEILAGAGGAAGQTVAASDDTGRARPSNGPRTLVLTAGRAGHYEVNAHVNGRPVRSLIDTGATTLALPGDIARAAGINPARSAFTARVRTANGIAQAAPVRVRELRLGTIRLTNVEALVMPDGALSVPLIGMSVLGRLKTVDIRSGTMRLVQ